MKTSTLHRAPYLLRSCAIADGISVIAVPFKYCTLPILKWMQVVVVNPSNDRLEDFKLIEAFGLHWIRRRVDFDVSLDSTRGTTLHPLEEIVFSFRYISDLLAFYVTVEYCRKGKIIRKTIKATDLPDEDDMESHGIYNLLEERRITPEYDKIEERIRKTRMVELLRIIAASPETLKKTPSTRFEQIISGLFEQYGFSVKLTGKTGDGGVDIIAVSDDRLSPSKHLIQCKRYKNHVGIAVVRELYGVKTDLRANRAILVTTSEFTKGAKQFAERNAWEIGLIDYNGICAHLKNMPEDNSALP